MKGVSLLMALAMSAGLGACSGSAARSGGDDSGATEFPPFALSDVDFTRDCARNPAFERLLTVLFGPPDAKDRWEPANFDEPLHNATGGITEHRLEFSEAKDWNGLRLREVRAYLGIESGPVNYTLAFEDSAERVREVWNARGWNLPPTGQLRTLEGEDIHTAVGIETDGTLTLVTCYID